MNEFRRAFGKFKYAQYIELHRKGNSEWYRNVVVLERRDRDTMGRKEALGGKSEEYDANESFL